MIYNRNGFNFAFNCFTALPVNEKGRLEMDSVVTWSFREFFNMQPFTKNTFQSVYKAMF